MDQDVVIKDFIEALGSIRKVELQVTSWPDKNNSSSADIDALVEVPGIKIALEHTSIDTLPDQRLDSARFVRLNTELMNQLDGKFSDRVIVAIPFYALQPGQDWSAIRETLENWLLATVPTLQHGSSNHNVPGLPFKIYIEKRDSDDPRFILCRTAHDDNTLPARMQDLVERKARKLLPYAHDGYDTFLLIESGDIALMDTELMVSAVEAALERNSNVVPDEVWYADTSIPAELEYWCVWAKAGVQTPRQPVRVCLSS